MFTNLECLRDAVVEQLHPRITAGDTFNLYGDVGISRITKLHAPVKRFAALCIVGTSPFQTPRKIVVGAHLQTVAPIGHLVSKSGRSRIPIVITRTVEDLVGRHWI